MFPPHNVDHQETRKKYTPISWVVLYFANRFHIPRKKNMGVCISQCKKTTTKTIMTPKKRTLRIIFGQTKIDERIIIMNSHSQMMVYENDGRIRLMKLIFFSFISIKKNTHTHIINVQMQKWRHHHFIQKNYFH